MTRWLSGVTRRLTAHHQAPLTLPMSSSSNHLTVLPSLPIVQGVSPHLNPAHVRALGSAATERILRVGRERGRCAGSDLLVSLGRSVFAATASILMCACDFPTDRSGELTVQLDDIPPLVVNDSLRLNAWVSLDGDTLPNARVSFSADNQLVLNLTPDGRLLAVGPGQVTITAAALSLQQAQPATRTITVSDVYELDSIRPVSVRFGETVQLYGVGLTQTIAASIGGADAIPESYVPEDPERRDRFGVLSLFAAPPATSQSQIVLVGFEGVLISDTIEVVQRDLYEPNDTVPRSLGGIGTRLRNPALAFERVRRGDGRLAVDWYTFSTDGTEDWTISAWSPAGGARFKVYVTKSMLFSSTLLDSLGLGVYAVAAGDWGVGTSFRPCGGLGLRFRKADEYAFTFEVPPDSAVIPLAAMPAGTYHVLVTYGQSNPFYDPGSRTSGVGVFTDSLNLASPLRAGLEIRRGYHSILTRDAFEENDYCDVASNITVPGSVGSLTIDSPHDADWYKFRIDTAQRVRFSIETSGVLAAIADLDTYVVRDFRPDSLVVVDVDVGAEAANQTTGVELAPGNYFLIVVDFLGVPTHYTLISEVLAAAPAPIDAPTMQDAIDAKRRTARLVPPQPGHRRQDRDRS